MSIFKKIEKSLPTQAKRLVIAATKALIPLSKADENLAQWSNVAGCLVGDSLPKHQHWDRIQETLRSVEGSKLVFGWCIESIRRRGIDKMVVLFERHIVLQLPSGELMCPTTSVGHEVRFINDPTRPDDQAQYPAWNIAVYSNMNLPGLLGSLPAHHLGWTTNWGGNQAYSRDVRHSKWMAWGNGNPRDFVKAQGLNPNNLIDIVLCSDIDEVIGALQVHPHPSKMPQVSVNALLKEIYALHEQGVFKIQNLEVAE